MKRRNGFTLVELLVVITIIVILSGLSYGALQLARESARETKTKATIVKLNDIVMRQYESFGTRRMPIRIEPCPWHLEPGMTQAQIDEIIAKQKQWTLDNHWKRLNAIRDLMRMELPDAATDITNDPISFAAHGTNWTVPKPALHRLYAAHPPTTDHDSAQCLYMIVSMGNPEAMEQFNQSEIGQVGGKPCFVDGWGRPIMFLRWAPGYVSPIQSGDVNADHDPFDTRKVDAFAFHLIPLIYSAGGDGVYDLGTNSGAFNGNPYASMTLGAPIGNGHHDNITNHSIDQR